MIFPPAPTNFDALAAHDAKVMSHGAIHRVGASLFIMASVIRITGPRPRSGLGELNLPENEPGSSIMPGKVNPTQIEALVMVCLQVMGNDAVVALAGAGGQLELNACKPVIVFNVLMAARNLGDACASFAERCVRGLEPNRAAIDELLRRSLMLVTALTPHVGYEHAAEIAHEAHREGSTLREAALALGRVSAEDFDAWCDPSAMLGPGDAG
jgi:fumarate hydratase class II